MKENHLPWFYVLTILGSIALYYLLYKHIRSQSLNSKQKDKCEQRSSYN